jgi:hypothetical protein
LLFVVAADSGKIDADAGLVRVFRNRPLRWTCALYRNPLAPLRGFVSLLGWLRLG